MGETVEIQLKVIGANTLKKDLDGAKRELSGFSKDVEREGKQLSTKSIAIGTAIGGALLQGIQLAFSKGVDLFNDYLAFDDQLASVRKSVGFTKDEVKKFGDELLVMSRSTRTSVSELAKIAQVGGQLGIGKDQILEFTKAIDKLNVALGDEFSGGAEEITNAMGGLREIFRDVKTSDISTDLLKIGNAVNVLGAQGRATGPVITDFASRIGGLAGELKAGNILGLSAALQELNITAERGGSAVGRIVSEMAKNYPKFAKVAKMSTEDFKNLVDTDLNGAFIKILESVNGSGDSMTELTKIMDDLKLNTSGEIEVFKKLAGNTDLLREKQLLANTELGNTNSIMEEFNIKNETSAAKIEIFGNRIKEVAFKAIAPFAEAIANLLDAASSDNGMDRLANSVVSGSQVIGQSLGVDLHKIIGDISETFTRAGLDIEKFFKVAGGNFTVWVLEAQAKINDLMGRGDIATNLREQASALSTEIEKIANLDTSMVAGDVRVLFDAMGSPKTLTDIAAINQNMSHFGDLMQQNGFRMADLRSVSMDTLKQIFVEAGGNTTRAFMRVREEMEKAGVKARELNTANFSGLRAGLDSSRNLANALTNSLQNAANAAVRAGSSAVTAGLALKPKQKFAGGGIVGGSSTSGDRNIVAANSGEMFITREQQGQLFNVLKNLGSRPQVVVNNPSFSSGQRSGPQEMNMFTQMLSNLG